MAPIQISYLGYPGSTGANCMDYLIADKVIIPEKYKKFYTEKIIYMPNCYQCNDNKRKTSEKLFTKSELGLQKILLFCLF